MRLLVLSSLAAGTLAVAAAMAPANALPAQPIPLASGAPEVTLVWGGCGPYRHPTAFGCRPNLYGGYGYGYGWRRPWGWRGGYGWRRGWRRW